MRKVSYVLLLLLAAGHSVAAETTVQQLFARVNPSVVTVNTPDSLGSGFIVSPDGTVVTNYHVIKNARKATVRVVTGGNYRDYDVIGVIAYDPQVDYAVLKIAASGLPALSRGNSDTVAIGEKVVAIGNPHGFEHTVSEGIVSQKRADRNRKVIQISNAIDHGSSGGPLLNMGGEVIGITTFAISGELANFNFAVAINDVRLEAGDRLSTLDGLADAEHEKEVESIRSLYAVYRDPEGAFSVVYPKGWRIDRCSFSPAETSWAFVKKTRIVPQNQPVAACRERIAEGFSIEFGYRRSGSDFDLDVWIKQIVDGASTHEGFEMAEQPHVLNFAGLPARMFTVTNSKRHTIEQNIFVWRKPLYEVSLTFVTPAQNVKQNRNYLDAAIESFQVLDPQSPTGGVAERRFGVHVTPVNSGLRVTSLVNGGFAESIGLMQGDIILSINGRHLTTQTDIDRFRDSLPVGSAVEFEVYRGSNDDFFPPVRRRLAGRF